jgi:hypothetical protein
MLNPGLVHSDLTPLAGVLYGHIVEAPLQILSRVVDEETLHAIQRFLHDHLHGVPVRTGLVHGDFSVHNLFVEGTQVTGVIDWEYAREDGLPLLDALNYLESVHRFLNQESHMAETVPLLASNQWPVPEESLFLRDMYALCGINASLAEGFAYLYWMQHVANQLEGSFLFDTRGIQERVLKVARRLVGRTRAAAAV